MVKGQFLLKLCYLQKCEAKITTTYKLLARGICLWKAVTEGWLRQGVKGKMELKAERLGSCLGIPQCKPSLDLRLTSAFYCQGRTTQLSSHPWPSWPPYSYASWVAGGCDTLNTKNKAEHM